MNIGERIAHYRILSRLTQRELADVCGFIKGQSRVSQYETNTRSPSLDDLRRLASAFSISLSALVDPPPRTELPTAEALGITNPNFALIPQYSAQAAAGQGQSNEHVEHEGALVFKRAWLNHVGLREQHLYVIYVTGQSMAPTLADEDVVLIDQSQNEPKDGRIYLLRKPDGDLIIKRLIQSITGAWTIRSDNPDKTAYPDQPLSQADIEALHIVGRCVWHGGGFVTQGKRAVCLSNHQRKEQS